MEKFDLWSGRRHNRTFERMHRSPAIAVALLLLLTGCEQSTPSAPTPAPASSGTGAGGCDAAAGQVKDRLARPGVENVTVDSACATATVTTTLSDGDVGAARQLCDLAAEVGYSGSVHAIRVVGQSGKVLATGAKGASCQSAG
jgi:hypothetical protein